MSKKQRWQRPENGATSSDAAPGSAEGEDVTEESAEETGAQEAPAPPALRPGHVLRRVTGALSAMGYSPEGIERHSWAPGEVAEFRQYVVDSAPHCFELP